MKLKNIDIIKSVTGMKVLSEKSDIPFSTSLIISKNASLLDSAITSYMSDKQLLDESYLTFSSDGKPIFKPGCEESYLKELTSLNEKEVCVDIIKIDPKALCSVTFPPKLIDSISFIFKEVI